MKPPLGCRSRRSRNSRIKRGENQMSKMGAVAALFTAAVASTGSIARADDHSFNHVLLLSVDGLHAVDLANCVVARTCPHLAQLTETGITYTNAVTTKPSDSFPGMLAQVTGATSKSTGVFYDDSYDRTLFAPSGGGAGCTSGPGAETQYAENIHTDFHSITSSLPPPPTHP